MISIVVPARSAEWSDALHVIRHLKGWGEAVVQGGSGGCAHARNLGAKKARGDILVFLDTDSEVSGDLTGLGDSTADFWSPKWFWVDPSVPGNFTHLHALWISTVIHTGLFPLTYGPFIAVRRAAFEKVGGFTYDVAWEDLALGMRLRRHGFRFGIAPVDVTITRRLNSRFERRPAASSLGKELPGDGPYRRILPDGMGHRTVRMKQDYRDHAGRLIRQGEVGWLRLGGPLSSLVVVDFPGPDGRESVAVPTDRVAFAE